MKMLPTAPGTSTRAGHSVVHASMPLGVRVSLFALSAPGDYSAHAHGAPEVLARWRSQKVSETLPREGNEAPVAKETRRLRRELSVPLRDALLYRTRQDRQEHLWHDPSGVHLEPSCRTLQVGKAVGVVKRGNRL